MNKLFEKFQGYVLDTPEKIALSSMGDGKTVTYRELDLISGKVYRYLMAHGIGREDFVNILLPRGVEPVIAMIGVWKAGAAFIMLEQDYPQERIAFIRRDCGCKLVIDDEAWTEILQCETLAGFAEVNDHDAAFAVYTSGTTGDPKGVLHEYGNLDLIARSYYENGVSPLTADDHFAMISPLHFITVILFYVGVLDAGGRMSIVPFSIAKNPQEIYKAFVENKIDVLFCAPSILRYFRNIPTVNRIIVGSEPANGIWSDDPRLRIWNAYSMSEVAFLVAFGQLEQPCEIAPVGKPLTDMKITLRDAEGRPVPEGETGELCVEDPYVRGYINRPEENLRAFVNGEFHTGDLARMLPDGQYVVLGRIDDMIKISGNRVEPAEIEVAVSRVSGLKQVIAAGFREGPDAFICLYYADPVEIDTEELRKKLESVLPYYMIPSRFIHLDALPRTTTGKISRRLLPKPEVEAGKYVAPENDTERALCVAMASVLGLERFGAEDDFYALGGSSVTSMEVVSICGLAGLSINQIFRGRTPKRIAEYYLEALPHEEASVGNEDNLTRPCPLTQSQLGIFLECEKRAGEAVYNNPMLFSLPDDTDMAILSVALEKTVRAHPGLFSGIVSDAHGGPAMRYQSAYAEREICIHQRMTEEEFKRAKTSLVQPFDIKRERLFRIRLIEAGEAKYLFMDFHHLVFDGTSMRILMADLDKALGGEDVEAEIWTAFDAAMAEQSARQDKTAWETARAWNLKRFGDVDSLALPAGDLRGSGLKCGEQAFALDISYSALKAFCERQRTTENVLTTAAFGVLMSAYTLKKDALFTTVYNGRRDLRCRRTVSMFVTTLPVLCSRGRDLSVAQYLSSLKEQLLGSMANDLYSFAELAAETGITSDVQFVWQADMLSLPKGSALKLKREELPFIATGDALSAQLFPEDDKLIFHLQYHADRYSEAFIARFAEGMNQVLKDMMAKERLSEVSLVSDEERGELLALSRGETLICDARQTWLDLFLENVNRIPEKTAVVDSEGSYTYRELDQASDTIAAFLRARGVSDNSFVAVRMDRVKAFVAAVIGIHKAGAAYLPIDLDYPEERVRYMLSDSGAKLVLTEDKAAEILSTRSDSAAFDGRPGISPDQLAYMIYTSGSTGKPKGVMIQHRALYHFVQFIRSRWGLGENSRIALHSNFAFDAAVEDLFPPLAAGGTVCIVPESARRDPEEMRAFLRRYAINGGSYSTQFGQLLAADEPLDVDYLCVGGEAMTIVPKARGPVYNAYGPTEFTVDATYYELDKTRDYRTIPIGRPVHNCAAYIMDPWGGLLPRGFTGELCLAGPQIALGYWNQPELTREKFTPIDLGEGQVRIYHTGDLARYNGEGNLEYLGRMDTQVKLRGFRIELGEVESTAARYDGIALAAAEVKKDQLILYYSRKEDASGQDVDAAAFREFLSDSLADYMVPSIFMELHDMPLTPNGKIDRKALPEPTVRQTGVRVAPEGEAECAVAEGMKQVLGMDNAPGALDSFFELGGDSIRAIRLVSLLREMGLQVSVADIMKQKTVRGIASCAESGGTVAISQEPYEGAVPDSAIVAFFKDMNLPCPHHYNQTRLLRLPERAKKDALQKAWDALVYQHDMLRAVFKVETLFVQSPATTIGIEEYTVDTEDTEAVTAICERIQTGIDMEKHLVRTALIHGVKNDYFYIAVHHLIIDGVSWRIILSDLETAYGQMLQGQAVRLPSKTSTYCDYAKALLRFRDSYLLSLEIPYWTSVQKKLADFKTADGKDYQRVFARLCGTLSPEETRGFLRADFGKLNADINDALLTAVCRGFGHATGRTALSVQLEGHGREDTGDRLSTDRTVGWFTSEYPVIVEGLNNDLRHDFLTAKEGLHRVPNKGFGYNVLRFLDGERPAGLDKALTAQLGFNYLGNMSVEAREGVHRFEDTDIPVGNDISPLNSYGPDIAINCYVQNGSFRLLMDFNTALYDDDLARRFADEILSQLREITKYLSSEIAPSVTATDLGETAWSDEEFETVISDFALRGETLKRIYPLLPMQEGMLLKAVSEPESYAYRLVDVFEVDGNPTEEMLRRVLDRLGRKHEVLRTAIIHDGVSVPRQAIVDRKLGLHMISLSEDEDAKEAVMRIREDILRDGFDLQRKPLFSVTCVKAQEGHAWLLTAVHHIIVDGWCTGLYMDSLVRYLGEELRNSEMTGDAAKASPDTGNNDAGRYEAAVREILKKDMYAGLAYWEELLGGYETRAAVPSYGIVPEALRSKEDEAYISISPEVTARFEQICREAGATISNGVELAWGMVLGTCSRQDDVVFAKVVSGRDNAGVKTEDVVGLFINSVPVRIRIDQNTTARAALKALQAQTARSNAYDYCPLSEIQKRSYPGSDLLQTVLAFENYNSGREETVSEDILKPVCTREERFDELSLSAYLKDGKLILQASYDTSLYREAEIRQVLALFKTYVEQMSAGPDRRLYTFEHVAAREREEVLALSGGKRLPFDQKQTWLALFLGIADHTPSITAVVDSRGSYTYGELDALSNRIAARLIQMGVGENSFVAIKMDRVKEFIAAVIGVQKAGAAYVPIDPAYPEDRIAYMLEDSGASVTLDEAAVASLMADDSAAKPLNRATPGHRAYMIYTSGSTGKPKGVIIHHHALRAYVAWAARDFGYQAGRHYAHSVTFSFDASVTDIVCPLCVGAQVHVLSDEIRLNPSRLADYLRENQIHGVKFPTQLGMLMLNSYPDLFPEFTVLGGEKLLPVAQTHVLMYNEYGPTEFTIGSSVHLVDQQKDVDIPIGRPVPNTWSLICDAQGRLLPRGMVGELCLAGAQIAEGYLNRPELTAEKFTDCPYLPGEKMYHTGDLARYNEEDELLCLGRIDTQVKLRGFRIELGEIETRASQYPGIQAVAAQVCKDQLVLYYTHEQGREITQEALRPFLAETLADYMVPAVYMPLDKMPMTPNGKIDRKALPEPERRLKEIVAPESPTEKQVLDLAAQMLGEAGFGVTDDLVSLGMSSLLAMRFAAALQSRHDARVRVSDIMKTPTVRGISALIDKANHAEDMALRAFEKRERYPLSENQRGLYIEWEINRNTTQYNIPAVYRFRDANAHALVQAVKAAVEAHPCLKIRLVTEDEAVMQQRHDDERVEVTLVTSDHDPDQEYFQQRVRPFDLFRDRLYRFEVIDAPSGVYLFMDIHHILFDGLSATVFLGDVLKACRGEVLTPERYDACDYALHERKLLDSDETREAEGYFDGLLSEAEVLRWPDSVHPDGMADAMVQTAIPAAAINAFCASEGVTVNSFMQAAFAEAMSRLTREAKGLSLTVSNGRSAGMELLSCVGMFVKTIPVVRPAVEKDTTAAGFIKAVHGQLQQSYAKEFYPYTRLVERRQIRPEIMMIYQGGVVESGDIDGIEPTDTCLTLDAVKFPIAVTVHPEEGRYVIRVEYDGTRYSGEDMMAMARAIGNMSLSMAENPLLVDAETVDEQERNRLLQLSSGEKLSFNRNETWLTLFHTWVEKTPDHMAVADSEGSYTYAELDHASDKVALYLIAHGVTANSFVAVSMGRVKAFVAAVLGIQKAGAAYVPIDPEYPQERIAYMLEDSGSQLVLDEALIGEILSADGGAVCAESHRAASVNRARPDGYAYMIYTSGSTGKPKGVVQSHRSLRAFIAWRENIVGRESVNAVHASFSFDASLDDLLCPLALGGQVHILSEALRRDLAGMKAYFEANRVTGVTFSTQIGMEMVNSFPDMPLRYVMMGGEKMLPCKKTDVKLINGYGPTEFTVCSSYHVVKQQGDDDIPIGRPVPNTWSLICDSQGHLLPRGMTGELCLAGAQIAEGYWKQPELTSEKFVRCPFLPGEKMYRTGDLARYNAAGELEYLGRIDHQVKLRGFRIELGEIESRASQYTGIQAVAAEVRRDQLVLYYTHVREITSEELRLFLAETLADYMVPAVYMPLEAMPMTPNGKIDRKTLPEPTSRSVREHVACVGEAEEAVAAAMLQVLNMAAAPGALDSFFELGGDSIRAIRLSSLLRDGGFSVSVSDIMNLKTVRDIARAAKAGEGTGISQEPFEGSVEDTPIAAWFRSLALPEPWHFNQTQLLSLTDSLPEDRLDANQLQEALNALVYQHDMLRAVYREGRLIVRDADAIIPVETYSASSEAEITNICAGIQTGIDMASALIRAALIHGRDRDYFYIAAHHLVIDGISWRIILSDLESAFAQARENKAIRLPGKTSTYQDYARAVHVWRDSYRLGLEIPYWKRVQKKLLALPTSMGLDHSRQFGHVEVAMDAGDTARFLHTGYGAFNLEINDVLLTAVCRSFRESQKTDSLSVQMEGHGREYIGEGLLTDRTVGWFTSIYPVIFENLNGDLEHDLKTVKETLHRVPNKGVGYNILRMIGGKEEVDFPTDRIARIGFNYLGEMDAEASAEGACFDSADIPTGPDFSPKNVFGPDLSINCLVQKGQFCLVLDYNQALYSARAAQDMADGILSQLGSIREYLSVCNGPMTTASDLGETQWSEETFEAVMADFAARGERVERIYPMLPLQEGMLLKHLSEPESWAYRLVSIFEMEGLPSEDQLRRALKQLGEKHEVLRTAIIHKNVSVARQAIVDRQLGLDMADLSGEEDQEAAVLQLREEILSHGFDLQDRPLFGLTCAKKDGAHCYLIIATHHIIVDGWCIQLYMGDLFRFLREALCGQQTEDNAPSTMGRYEAAVREILQKDLKQGLSYWRTLLSDYETKAEIPSYGVVPEGERAASDELAITLTAEETRRFEALCRREGATINNGTELLWGLVLGICGRTEDVVFAKVVSGRDNTRTRVDDVVGLFINSVPVRVRWDRNTTAREALRSLQAQTAAGNAWDFCPLSAIQQETALGSELLSTVMAFENYVGGEEDLKQEGHLRPVLTREEHFDAINPSAYVSEGCLTFHITFDRSLYRETEIQRVLKLFGQLARGIIQNPDAALSSLKLLDTEASKAVLKLSEGARLAYDRSETWLTLFHAWAKKTPDHTAVVDSEGSYTYAELDQASNAVAAYLIDHGVKQNSFVAVTMDRVKAFVATIIGIQKAGAAYVPVDPDYPEERIAYILEDSEAKTVMTEETYLRALEDYPNAAPVNRATPAQRAYMIYTSGSTGKPKGVIQSHRSLRAFTAWRTHDLGIDSDSIHAVHASFAFDASLDDLICPLASGGTIHILSDELRRDMAGMKDYFARHHITALTMSTQIGMSMVNQYPDMGLRFVMMGGEKMLPCAKTGIRLINGYGPTEFTVCSSFHVVNQDKDVDIPIGRPVPNTWSFICNENGNLLPQGIAGELCLAGPQIAEGYWKQKALTDEKFVPCPFLDGQDAKMYRTGDLARYNEDGELEFLGRIDTQVKLRGYRIELGEIETAAIRHEWIAHAVAEVCEDQLVLFYTANRPIEQDALRGMLTKSLTEYMIPSVFVQLDELPMTPNGKVDRKALRKMSVVSDEDVVIPENESEKKLSDLVSEVLSGRKVSVTSELQREGLTSIAAMRLGALISQAFGKSFRLSDLKVYGTIRKIARHLFTESEEEPFGLQASYPLSSVQQGIYVESMANFNSTVYNTPALLKLDRDVDIARLKQAIIQAVNAHPYMKMRLSSDENGQIIAERRDEDQPFVHEVEFDSLQNGFDNLVYPFRLIGDSLFRISIIRSESANYLFVDGHHIAFDGESIQIFMRDINRAYAGETLTKESFTGFEVALLEEKLRQGTHFETAKEYYTTLLDGIDTDCLPVYDKDMEAMEIGYLTVDAPADMDNMLSDVVKDGGVTLNGLWNAAFGLALSRFLYRDDSVYTTIYNGRNDSRLSESVGMFVHTLPVVCRVEEGESGIAYAKRIGQQLTDSMTNDIYSFAEISRQFDIKANIIFAYQGRLGADVMVGGRKAESIPLELNAIKAQLMINVYEKDDGFEITCEYDSQHFEAWNVRALLKAAVRAFSGLIRDQKISEISLVSPDEKRMMDACNQTERPVEPTDIVTLFRRTAEKRPQNTAVIYKDKVLTYQALDDLSDRVAAYLQDKGIGAGDVVGILIPRNEYMVVTALGALKAGAAYQPLDPTYPAERLRLMIEDSAAKALIEDEALKALIPDYAGVVLDTRQIEQLPARKPLEMEPGPDALFILLYTSGTTGVPKGVMLTHGNLVNFCQWYRNYFTLTEDSIVSAYASFGFDACMMDLYPALTTGACVCIVPEEMKLNPPELNAYFEKNRVSHAFMTTQMARMFAINFKDTHVKVLIAGGEKLVPFAPEGNFTFYNGYGPTECTIFSTIYPVEGKNFRVPIGVPLDNCKAYVVGKNGLELPVGAVGELWISGFGVAKGYLNKPELTEKAFLRNPFCDAPGFDCIYRTGDIVRRLPDGKIDFVGRKDEQVKIRGFRIELTEVEGAIRGYNGIRNATVQAFDDPSGNGKYIAAYVVAEESVDFAALSDYIRSTKPDYMVPSAFMQLDAIPLNQNQKVNRKKLPIPSRREEKKANVEPTTPLEKEICEAFARILGLNHVGALDSFFELGGTSITAASMLTYAIRRGYRIVYKDVFDNPTPRQLAHVIAGQKRSEKSRQAAEYDYDKIDRFIAYNAMEHVDEIASKPLGDVILTGATGFLGIHVLAAFLAKTEGRIYCLMRKNRSKTLEARLMSLMVYYFGETHSELFGNRIFCVEGDITDKESLLALDGIKADMIINCAACVKHFIKDDLLDRINYHGVENLIEACLKNDMKLVHVSTLSVGGSMPADQAGVLYENMLYMGQYVDNDYVRTKFLAERAILSARVERSLNAVILRAGNLMGRYTDGEFQINFSTNAFMRSLGAYKHLGVYPITSLAQQVEFSPIDATADAVLALAGVDSRFSIFNINNNHSVPLADIVFAMKHYGFKIQIVSQAEFERILHEASEKESESETIMSLLAYETGDDENLVAVKSDNFFTTNALYRLDFQWPIIDNRYLVKLIAGIDSLGFFDRL